MYKPNNLIINYLKENSKYKLVNEPQITPILTSLRFENNMLQRALYHPYASTLIVVDEDDLYRNKKIKWIRQLMNTTMRLEVIKISDDEYKKINEREHDNQYNTISHHVPTNIIKKNGYVDIKQIEKDAHVTVYHDSPNGLATYSGLIKALMLKTNNIKINRISLGQTLNLEGFPLLPIFSYKDAICDELVNNETNWRFKTAYMRYVDTPLGPVYLNTTERIIMNDRNKKEINKKIKRVTVNNLSTQKISSLKTTIRHTCKNILKICYIVIKIIIRVLIKTIKNYKNIIKHKQIINNK